MNYCSSQLRVCVVIPFILDVRLFVDVPAGVTQKEGYTGLLHLPSAVLALTFLARRIQSLFSLVDREVECCCVLTSKSFSIIICRTLLFYFISFFVRKNLSPCDCIEIRTHVPTSEGFEVTN